MPGAFVVDAAAAEGIEHEPRTGDAAAPERLIEEDRDPQIVARPVVVSHVLGHRASQPHAGPFDRVQPRMRQRDDHCIEVVPHNVSALPDRNDVAIARCFPPVAPVALFVMPETRTTGALRTTLVLVRCSASRRGSISIPPSIEY